MMKKCTICEQPITDKNKSKEHIIHQAIGGSYECDGIYCKECNGKYGSSNDKDFTQIFAPIVDRIDIHKTRKTKGTSYTGVMCDELGNLYKATYKDGKVIKLENENSEYVKYESEKYKTLYYHFQLDNKAFKLGFSKIAFNYAICCGFQPYSLEKIFDFESKKLRENPIVIPFVPMTEFDSVIESSEVTTFFHAVRVFNCENNLYAYIELFNTFQNCVLLSEKNDFLQYGDIDKSFANSIETKEKVNQDLLKSLTPQDYKDADILCKQYGINLDNLVNNLKEFHKYDSIERCEQVNMLFSHIGKKAYEQICKESYIKDYFELMNCHYDSIDFKEHFLRSEDNAWKCKLFSDFEFYTVYEKDNINFNRYKKFLPDGTVYPIAIIKILNNNSEKITGYGHMKFQMLQNLFK